MNIEKIVLEVANELGWSLESSEKFIACCLSKLAEQDVEPVAYTCNNSFYRLKPCSSINGEPFIPLYTETQLLGAQQRAAKALIEPMAKVIYRQWWYLPEYTAWVDGGNSFKQDDARRIARNVVVGEDWREYL